MPRVLKEKASRPQTAIADATAGLPSETAEQIKRISASVPGSRTALSYIRRIRELQPVAFSRIVQSRVALQYLITTFAYSHFLSEELLQNPHWVEALVRRADMHRVLRTDEYVDGIRLALSSRGSDHSPDARSLALFRRESLLRILLRDVLGFGMLSEITS